jgi:hypothetical protein
VDFKTGAIRDQSGTVRREYLRQLLLYAYLEHEMTGLWPSNVYLIPLEGSEAELSVDPQQSEQVALEARDALAAYNAAVPGAQPANPSEIECRYCPYATRCEAFWARSATWTDLTSVRGRIIRVARGQVPAVTIEVEVPNDAPPGESVIIRSIGIYEHPAVDQAAVGLSASAVGLIEEANRGTFRIAAWGRFEVHGQGEIV